MVVVVVAVGVVVAIVVAVAVVVVVAVGDADGVVVAVAVVVADADAVVVGVADADGGVVVVAVAEARMNAVLHLLRRRWCRMTHARIMFAGGPTYECRQCGERFEHPALGGAIKPLPAPQSVRLVSAPTRKRAGRVVKIGERNG